MVFNMNVFKWFQQVMLNHKNPSDSKLFAYARKLYDVYVQNNVHYHNHYSSKKFGYDKAIANRDEMYATLCSIGLVPVGKERTQKLKDTVKRFKEINRNG